VSNLNGLVGLGTGLGQPGGIVVLPTLGQQSAAALHEVARRLSGLLTPGQGGSPLLLHQPGARAACNNQEKRCRGQSQGQPSRPPLGPGPRLRPGPLQFGQPAPSGIAELATPEVEGRRG
jgi:hypothetical protein